MVKCVISINSLKSHICPVWPISGGLVDHLKSVWEAQNQSNEAQTQHQGPQIRSEEAQIRSRVAFSGLRGSDRVREDWQIGPGGPNRSMEGQIGSRRTGKSIRGGSDRSWEGQIRPWEGQIGPQKVSIRSGRTGKSVLGGSNRSWEGISSL